MNITHDTIFNGQIPLIQPARGYRFGYDALLLSFFTKEIVSKRKDRVKDALEIGGGCGIISIILVLKDIVERIVTVEVQKEFVDIIARNVKNNGVENRIQVVHKDINEYKPGQKFDLVIANPPYQPINTGRVSPDPMKAISRQELKLTLEELAYNFSRLLKPGTGIGTVIYPCFRMSEVIHTFTEKRLYPFYIRIVHPYPGGNGELFLMAVKNMTEARLVIGPPVYIHTDREHKIETEEMKKITSGNF